MQAKWAIQVFIFIVATIVSVDRISIPQQVQFSGDIVGESAMHSEVDVGSQIIHRYQVIITFLCILRY